MTSAILDQNGKPYRAKRSSSPGTSRKQRKVRATWDAASDDSQNLNHWGNADQLSAMAAANPAVRTKLRARSRYEIQNNSYAIGIVNTIANHTVGTGPRLQYTSPDEDLNNTVESQFQSWARSIKLAHKVRLMVKEVPSAGEVFGVGYTRENQRHAVKLDIRVIEAGLVKSTSASSTLNDPYYVDGIQLDINGDPVRYDIHDYGADTLSGLFGSFSTYDANQVVHLKREDFRPDSIRGIPELTPALPIFAQLRRYVLAVLSAAETAADYAAVMYTDHPSLDSDEIPNIDMSEMLDIERNMFQILPNGWKISQLRAEQPTTQFESFRNAMINEAARCVNMPFNIAAGNSSDYNYASGRLDHQDWYQSVEVRRLEVETEVLAKVFDWWIQEAARVPEYLPISIEGHDPSWVNWHWPGREHVDPAKEANAQSVKLKMGLSHLYAEYAKDGKDAEKEIAKAAESFGVSPEEYKQALFHSTFNMGASSPANQSEESEDDVREDEG